MGDSAGSMSERKSRQFILLPLVLCLATINSQIAMAKDPDAVVPEQSDAATSHIHFEKEVDKLRADKTEKEMATPFTAHAGVQQNVEEEDKEVESNPPALGEDQKPVELPITGWSDALTGRIDDDQSCEHLRGLVTMYQERFKSNTRNDLEELYGASIVLEMEKSLQKKTQKYDDLLEQGGCFKEDPHLGKISNFALWSNKDPAIEACGKLFGERRQVAESYQGKVRSMLLSKDYDRFVASLNTLYTVSKSLHL